MGERYTWRDEEADNSGRVWSPPMSDADRRAYEEAAQIEYELRQSKADQMRSKPLATMGDQTRD